MIKVFAIIGAWILAWILALLYAQPGLSKKGMSGL